MRAMVAVPTHSGAVDTVAVETLLQLQKLILVSGGELALRFHSGSTISVLRNLIVADFLQSAADVLFMLDSDQGLGAPALERMLDHPGEVVGCLYPKRRYDWSMVDPALGAGELGRILLQASDFVGRLAGSGPNGEQVEVVDGFARALFVGAGALRIRRTAFDRLKARYPELKGQGYEPREFPDPRFADNWGFFNPLSRVEAGEMLSEDFSFCHRWRGAGGELWAEVATVSAHVGRHAFTGAYLDYVRALGG